MSATARTAELRSALRGLRGFATANVTVQHDTSPLGTWTAIPSLSTSDIPPFGTVFAAAVVLDRGEPEVPEVAVDHDGDDDVTLTWPDGATTTVGLVHPHPWRTS